MPALVRPSHHGPRRTRPSAFLAARVQPDPPPLGTARRGRRKRCAGGDDLAPRPGLGRRRVDVVPSGGPRSSGPGSVPTTQPGTGSAVTSRSATRPSARARGPGSITPRRVMTAPVPACSRTWGIPERRRPMFSPTARPSAHTSSSVAKVRKLGACAHPGGETPATVGAAALGSRAFGAGGELPAPPARAAPDRPGASAQGPYDSSSNPAMTVRSPTSAPPRRSRALERHTRRSASTPPDATPRAPPPADPGPRADC
jgi:hypothetical protein